MKKLLLTAAVCLFALPMPAEAKVALKVGPTIVKQTCFTKADAEAEQAIRIHSELMIIGLNCQHSRFANGYENLYLTYRQFTVDHANQIAAYEKQMMDYFSRAGSRNPEASLNDMRTAFANKISLDVANMRPDMFCYQYSPRMEKIKGMSDEQFRQWAATSYIAHPPTHPMCAEK